MPELRGRLRAGRKRAGEPTASCRSRTRSAAASTATSTCSSSTSCRSSARSSCRSCITCWRCPEARSKRVRRIYSHPQALAQCDRFLRTLSGVEVIATYDTAGSAKLIAEQGMQDAAAIASARAAEVFGLIALVSSIQDYEHNVTRFLIVGRRPLSASPADKTSVVFHAHERTGRALQGAERLRAARDRSDQARIAAVSRPQVGIPVLRGPGRGAR